MSDYIKNFTMIPNESLTLAPIYNNSFFNDNRITHINLVIAPSRFPKKQSHIKLKQIRKYTLENFLERARQIHRNSYDYSLVTSDHIQSSKSKVAIRCNTCYYIWTPTINNHFSHATRCPNCTHNVKYTLERFLISAA